MHLHRRISANRQKRPSEETQELICLMRRSVLVASNNELTCFTCHAVQPTFTGRSTLVLHINELNMNNEFFETHKGGVHLSVLFLDRAVSRPPMLSVLTPIWRANVPLCNNLISFSESRRVKERDSEYAEYSRDDEKKHESNACTPNAPSSLLVLL